MDRGLTMRSFSPITNMNTATNSWSIEIAMVLKFKKFIFKGIILLRNCLDQDEYIIDEKAQILILKISFENTEDV